MIWLGVRFAVGDFAGDSVCELPEGAAGGTAASAVEVVETGIPGAAVALDGSTLAVAVCAACCGLPDQVSYLAIRAVIGKYGEELKKA